MIGKGDIQPLLYSTRFTILQYLFYLFAHIFVIFFPQYYVDSAFNNIPVSVCQDVEVGTINVGTNKISTSASGIDVDSIPQEIQMNMGLLEIIVTSVDSPTDLITLRCVTQVAKKASGGPLYRVFYSPL